MECEVSFYFKLKYLQGKKLAEKYLSKPHEIHLNPSLSILQNYQNLEKVLLAPYVLLFPRRDLDDV
jgi:hypothetical protein